MFGNGFNINFDSIAIFSFWDMVDFVLKIPSELGTMTNLDTLTSDTW